MPRRFLFSIALAVAGLTSTSAWAGPYDLNLSRLGSLDGNGNPTGEDTKFRTLSSELGTIMAPTIADSADSLGLSAFAVSADLTINTLTPDNWRDATQSTDPRGTAPTLQIMGRKGLWPGLEIGAGAKHMFDSRMWAMGGYAKIAFHEGFHHLPIPSIAARGSFSRLVGARDMNLSTAAFDVSLSHVFGVGKTFNITPYAGYQALFIFANSGVLDVTPGTDEFLMPAQSSEFVFRDSGAIVRHRPFLGARFIFSVMRLALEYQIVPGGGSDGELEDGTVVEDLSSLQHQFTISLGLDF